MKVKEKSEKVGLKLNIQNTKIKASDPITAWEIDGETMETVANFIFLGSKITVDGDRSPVVKLKNSCSLEEQLWQPRQHIEKQSRRVASKGPCSQAATVVLVTQARPALCDPTDCSPPGSSVHGSPGKSAGVGCHSLPHGIFLTRASNPGLTHCRQITIWATGKPYDFSSSHVWMWEWDHKRRLSIEELMLLNCGAGEDSWESLGLQGDQTSPS